MVEKFFVPVPSGPWTPRQALLRALQECDDWTDVVIMGLTSEGDTRGIQATANQVIRRGLFAEGLADGWDA